MVVVEEAASFFLLLLLLLQLLLLLLLLLALRDPRLDPTAVLPLPPLSFMAGADFPAARRYQQQHAGPCRGREDGWRGRTYTLWVQVRERGR